MKAVVAEIRLALKQKMREQPIGYKSISSDFTIAGSRN